MATRKQVTTTVMTRDERACDTAPRRQHNGMAEFNRVRDGYAAWLAAAKAQMETMRAAQAKAVAETEATEAAE
jgi:hypothetical protein